MPRPVNHISPVNLLWIVPLLAAEFWLLANPPAWLSAMRGLFASLVHLLLIPVVFLLWIGLCKLVASIFLGWR